MEQQTEGNNLHDVVFQQQNIIDDLEKRIRLIELNNKKRVIELENELKNEQRRATELEDELKKNIREQSDYEHIKQMNFDLQNKLTEHENLIVEQRQKEHQLNKQIRQLKDQVSNSKAFGSPYGRHERNQNSSSLKKYISPNQHDNCRNVQCFDESNQVVQNGDNEGQCEFDNKDLIRAILDLKQEKEDLIQHIEKIKEASIDAIMEKEKIIMELKEQIFYKDDIDGVSLKLDQMIQEKEEWQRMHESSIENYERTIQELQHKIEFEQRLFEERILNIETEINERVIQRFQQNLDSAKDVENNLIQQIKITEERLKMCDKTISDQQKVISNNKEQLSQYVEEINSLKSSLAQSKTFKEKISQLEKELSTLEKNSRKEIEQKQEQIEKLSRRNNELLKNFINFETENKRLNEQIENLNDNLQKMQTDYESLQIKYEEATVNYERDLSIQQQHFNEEKKNLLQELNDQKAGYKNRQSCLKSDIGYDEFSSCFDSPQISSKKRSSQKQQPTYIAFRKNSEDSNQAENNSSQENLDSDEENDFLQQLDNQTQESRSNQRRKSSDYMKTPECDFSLRQEQPLLRDITTSVNNNKFVNFHALNQSLPQKPSQKNCIKLQPLAQQTHQANSNIQDKENNIQLIAPLKQEIDHLKNVNEKLQAASESYENEIMKLQNELKTAYKQMQECRKSLADNINVNKEKESSLKCEIESLKTHIYKIETHMVTYKLQYEEDSSYLKEELKIAEKIAAESKVKLAQIMQDKDYFQQQYKVILAKYKQKKNQESQSHSFLRQNDYYSTSDTQNNFIVF
ncbi:hypothetical protein TTHERM_00292020 (macronuclear) [Tetrahymena thermophila SB210]|uniref:Uncharacterized protein n=1 Tax=Tetrahymena thermophila (strain SB210) TaxID=312017 RepID=I7M8M8_TETTS|nr:hypothetical protein TTHERM_00292020 [Tetrahymena thermophila SB210]EAR98475.1 hypothetical protein TTHERM_00292020 [Tetrahymena thermophila SB210]|eukprot:XP_001018720.1 hypothetical protein TTHERM_00292020 [Tetrahymena thermophila SB210]